MTAMKLLWKRLFFAQLLLFFMVFGAVGSAHAQGITYGDSVPAGQTIDNDAILYGKTVTVDGTVNGDVLAVGAIVKINGTIKGSLVVVGETVTINGQVDGTVYAAAVTLEIGPSAVLQRNFYYAGLDLVSQPGAQIARDMYAASVLGAQLGGKVGRDVKAIIGPQAFIKLIIDAFGGQINLPKITLPKIGSAPSGTQWIGLSHISKVSLARGGLLQAPVPVKFKATWQSGVNIDWPSVGAWAEARLREFVILLVFGFLGLWLFTPLITRSAEALRKELLPATGWGFLLLVISLDIFGVAILLAVLVFTVGLWLGFASLWGLAFAFWVVGFLTLGLATTLFALLIIYGTKIIVAYLAGNLLLKLITPKAAGYRMLSLLLGLVIFVLLHSIPYIGWVIGVVVTAWGLGAWLLMIIHQRRESNAEAA